MKFEGPWFTTQLLLATSIGFSSFLIFSYCRTRYPLMFAPRTKLKGFSPHEAHAHQAFFGWILPTIRTSEFTVLQIVGLDAAVLLNFFKMSFYLFSLCSFFAVSILMPLNWKHNKELGDSEEGPGGGDDDGGDDWPSGFPSMVASTFSYKTMNETTPAAPPSDWLDLFTEANTYLSMHVLFTFLFTILTLYFLYLNYKRFVRARQLFSLELVHSIPARTVLVTNLPKELQGERPLAEYFERMSMAVESVTVCREVGPLKKLLDRRTQALLRLEAAWAGYVGNPSSVEAYDPEHNAPLVDVDSLSVSVEAGNGHSVPPQTRLVIPHRSRPTLRPTWFSAPVDALEYLESQFRSADEKVKAVRRTGRFRATQSAFVTFEKMSSAQVAVQVAHASKPLTVRTFPAPEPRDIVWANMTPPASSLLTRDILVLAALVVLFTTWVIPVTFLAGLLSYKEIQRVVPWLARLIDSNEQVRALVQNTLPSGAMMALNGLLPFMLEGLSYAQGYRARSWVEYSLLRK